MRMELGGIYFHFTGQLLLSQNYYIFLLKHDVLVITSVVGYNKNELYLRTLSADFIQRSISLALLRKVH